MTSFISDKMSNIYDILNQEISQVNKLKILAIKPIMPIMNKLNRLKFLID